MKFTIILGRGVEGCGVTKYTVEQMKWLKKNGHEYQVFSARDKTWSRKESHDVAEITQLKFAKEAEMNKVIEACNNSDAVIINSLPSQGHSEECIAQFNRMLKEVKPTVVLIQHDHTNLSIKRNACLNESIERADLIFAHSSKGDFSKYVETTFPASLMDDGKEVFNFQPGIDFDSLRQKFWKDISLQDSTHNKWIGRTTSWKGYIQMVDFNDNFLSKAGYVTTLEGIERSPAFLGFKELRNFNSRVDVPITSVTDAELRENGMANVFGTYNNEEMLERMSKVGFGYQLSTLDGKYIERSIEYTHCELSCVGVVPVFRKSYGDRCTHRVQGDFLSTCKDSGTVWLDENNMQPAFELIDKLAKDNAMRDDYREMAYEFYRSHQDSEHTFKETFDRIRDTVNANSR